MSERLICDYISSLQGSLMCIMSSLLLIVF